jgi:hypothetical protein
VNSKYNAYFPYYACKNKLPSEDIVHYGKMVSALGETIRLMREVDGVIDVNGGWPVK